MKPDNRTPDTPGRDPDLVGAEAAMHRAAKRAHRRAAANGSPVAIFEHGKVVWMEVDGEGRLRRGPA